MSGALPSPVALAVLKRELRKAVRARVKQVSEEEIRRQSERVRLKLKELPEYRAATTVALFISMPHEIDTRGMIEDVFASGKRCFFPVITGQHSSDMALREGLSVSDIASWPENHWHIKEPPPTIAISAAQVEPRQDALTDVCLDLMIMPGVAFDAQCGRLGQGKGFYDKLLSTYQSAYADLKYPMVRTVAIGLNEQLVPEVPMDPTDYSLDKVCLADYLFEAAHANPQA
ncbi:5-formyltetrahydrofolate cyclo-ligase [Porphyridium purpureum]|uniref:5-formyltetrahydrofolate cyclo-ligase n=1 Tax=Porphyridium purpureum TaxID=35688 RepID=A0A5J4YP28_PORPP|nr:5-formyltetrahydrofolate cyclo-ligase [Porphyridium purpureum]|eukprot:POR4401..scf222_8